MFLAMAMTNDDGDDDDVDDGGDPCGGCDDYDS